MGMFGGLNAEAYDRSYTDRALLARIFKYFSAYRRRMILVSIATVAMAIFGALNPLLVSDGVESLVNVQTDLYLLGLIAVVLLIGVLNWVANWARRRLTATITGDAVLA
ncbi:MAG: ABC transporter ATP-binding protein, partial [Chloroflexi bacterium]|nr:ABC transporter ATP-binding protein [Chloroflexota bacterium]